jgi:competence ComEA-like helix-hairpin-helix protein
MNRIKINKATLEELTEIIHIGLKRAQLIIEYRKEQPFKDLYELSVIKGFGKKRINSIITEGKAVI